MVSTPFRPKPLSIGTSCYKIPITLQQQINYEPNHMVGPLTEKLGTHIYRDLSWYNLYILIFNIFWFGFGWVSIFVWDTETETEIFRFQEIKSEIESY